MRWNVPVTCPSQKHSPQPTQHSCHLRPQRFGSGISRNTSLMSGPPKPWEWTLPRVAGGCEHWFRGNAITTGLGISTASPLAGFRFWLQQRGFLAVTNAASHAALKGSDGCPSEVATARIEQYSGIGVSQNKQFLLSFHFAVISLVQGAQYKH